MLIRLSNQVGKQKTCRSACTHTVWKNNFGILTFYDIGMKVKPGSCVGKPKVAKLRKV